MASRAGIAAACVLFTLGCSGKTSTTSGGDGGGSSSGASSGSASGGNASSSGSSSGTASSGGSSSGGVSSGSGSSSGGATDASDTLDAGSAEVPDAFPATCSASAFALTPDGGLNECAFRPSDVTCDANADCVAYIAYGCGCFYDVWGVNKSSTARCLPPPCVAPMDACDPDASGLYTQECRFVPYGTTNLAAACVNHRCLSFAP